MLIEIFENLGVINADIILARSQLFAVEQYAKEKLCKHAPTLTEEYLIKRYKGGFSQANGFLQILPFRHTPAMLLMAYQICMGYTVKHLHVNYTPDGFRMDITIHMPDEQNYSTTDISDFSILRHILAFKIDEKPILDGFYPLQVG